MTVKELIDSQIAWMREAFNYEVTAVAIHKELFAKLWWEVLPENTGNFFTGTRHPTSQIHGYIGSHIKYMGADIVPLRHSSEPIYCVQPREWTQQTL